MDDITPGLKYDNFNNNQNYNYSKPYEPQFIENNYPPPPISTHQSNEDFIPKYTSKTYNANISSNKIDVKTDNNDNNILSNSSKPSVPTSSEENCCSRRDPSVPKITGCQQCLIIGPSLFLIYAGIVGIVTSSDLNSIYFGIFLSINITTLISGILEPITVLRIKWLRIYGSVLSVILLLGAILELIILKSEAPTRYDSIGAIYFFKIAILIIIMNTEFYAYWGIRICYRCENCENS